MSFVGDCFSVVSFIRDSIVLENLYVCRKFYDNYVIVKQPEKCVSLFVETPEVPSVCSR